MGLLVGLTGGMASGKSTVAELWRAWGAHVLSSDSTVHRLYATDPEVRAAIRRTFGEEVFRPDGTLDRARMAAIVFSDESKRRQLMAIVHPRTREIHLREARAYLETHPCGVVVIDSPLLFEAGLDRYVDRTVTVAAPHQEMVRRALERAQRQGRPLRPEEVERRIALQLPMDEKRRRATWVIENDGTLDQLRERARAVWEQIRAQACAS